MCLSSLVSSPESTHRTAGAGPMGRNEDGASIMGRELQGEAGGLELPALGQRVVKERHEISERGPDDVNIDKFFVVGSDSRDDITGRRCEAGVRRVLWKHIFLKRVEDMRKKQGKDEVNVDT